MSAEETVRAVPLAESGIGAIGQRLDAAKAAFAQAFNILRSLRDFDQCLSAAVNGPLIDALVKRDAPDAELADPSLSDEQYAKLLLKLRRGDALATLFNLTDLMRRMQVEKRRFLERIAKVEKESKGEGRTQSERMVAQHLASRLRKPVETLTARQTALATRFLKMRETLLRHILAATECFDEIFPDGSEALTKAARETETAALLAAIAASHTTHTERKWNEKGKLQRYRN